MMGSIAQKQLFCWKNIENLGDLERLDLVLRYLPDDNLIEILEKKRRNGRDKFPVEPMWNSILAGVVYQHISIESLRRELQRNSQLLALCGFELAAGTAAIAPSWAYSRFLKNLLKHEEEIKKMFDTLVKQLTEVLPDFGQVLAVDGKAIASRANGNNNIEGKARDGRRDMDGDWGKKIYDGKNKAGKLWEKVVSWFGYKLHLIVDAVYELPIEYRVTKASVAEQPVAHEMLTEMEKDKEEILRRCDYFDDDRGYDDGKLVSRLYDDYAIKPVIDIRNCWKDGEETRVVAGQENVVYDYKGNVFCVCPVTGKQHEMAYGGFEKDRGTLKYICPALAYGISCEGCSKCPVKKSVRIDMGIDRRIFTPLARSSYAWERTYAKRTAVERVNSRLDESFGFERHYIRG
jgi:hypothetical protein